MRRLLMMCGTFYPFNNPRAVQCTELYKELKKRGYDIDLCIPEKKKLYHSDQVEILLKEAPVKEKNYIKEYTPIKGMISKTVCFFIGQKAFYIYYPWLKTHVNINDYSAIICVSAPFYNVVLGARLMKRRGKQNIVSICDNGDPFYDPTKHSVFVRKIQEWAYSQFDYICFPVSSAKKYYIKYADEKKLKVIPQGRDFSSIQLKEYHKNDCPTFAYAGCFFTDIRNPDNFLSMLEKVEKPFRCVLFTETVGEVYQKILLKHKKQLKDKLEIHPFLPRSECIYELSGMDFLVNFQNMSQVQTPSKLIDYSLAKRPIYSTRQDNVNKKDFEMFLDGNYDSATKVDISMYDIRKIADQYVEMIEGDNDR